MLEVRNRPTSFNKAEELSVSKQDRENVGVHSYRRQMFFCERWSERTTEGHPALPWPVGMRMEKGFYCAWINSATRVCIQIPRTWWLLLFNSLNFLFVFDLLIIWGRIYSRASTLDCCGGGLRTCEPRWPSFSEALFLLEQASCPGISIKTVARVSSLLLCTYVPINHFV